MKNRRFFVIIIALIIGVSASSQIKNLGEFAASGVDDATELMKAYLTPWANALGTSLSGGWYNTAKVHKKLGFDLTLTFNMGFVPADAKNFNLDELNLSANAIYTENIAPTAAGKKQPGPEISYEISGITVAQYNTPQGAGLGFVPTPMVQAGVGIIKGTDLCGRFMPKMSLGPAADVKLWGFGLKHDILQWFPLVNKAPVVNLAIQGGFTNFKMGKGLSFTPDDIPGITDETTTDWFDAQSMELQVKSFTMNLLVSVDVPVFSLYGGVGIARTKTTLGLDGYYPIPTLEGTTPVVNDGSIREIPEMVIKNNDGSPAKPRINIGMRFKFGVITIHGDYTKANYSNVTVGLGVAFR